MAAVQELEVCWASVGADVAIFLLKKLTDLAGKPALGVLRLLNRHWHQIVNSTVVCMTLKPKSAPFCDICIGIAKSFVLVKELDLHDYR